MGILRGKAPYVNIPKAPYANVPKAPYVNVPKAPYIRSLTVPHVGKKWDFCGIFCGKKRDDKKVIILYTPLRGEKNRKGVKTV